MAPYQHWRWKSTSSHGDKLSLYDPYEGDQNFLEYIGNAVPRSRENSSLPNLLLWAEIGCGNSFMTAIQTSSSLGKIIKSTKGCSFLEVEFLKAH